jgi:hypothetical protein
MQVRYISNGISYILNGFDSVSGFTFNYLGDQGFGLAPMHRITTRGPLQQGDSDIDFRLDPRVLQLPLVVANTSSAGKRWYHYQIRERLLEIFQPQYSGVLQLTVLGLNGASAVDYERRINVNVLGGLSFDVDPSNYNVRTVVQLRASDPTWYESSYPSGNRFVVNYVTANINGSQVISVGGNWWTYPIIRLFGPITNPVITNSTTGQIITFTGTISAGAYYDIDLEYGKKTVVDNLGVNRISTVSSASAFATWSLGPSNNTISITGTGTTAATNAVFNFFYRFTGI